MKQTRLKEAMEQVNIQEDMQREIIVNVRRHMMGRRKRAGRWKKAAVTAAVSLLAVGVISIPVQAGIRYLIRERMEEIPREEVESLAEMIQAQETEADSFTRDYTAGERERMSELYKAYQNGTFPEGEIFQFGSGEQARDDGVSYEKETGRFYLPDRDLTDEELLEIIDFNYKRDYSLSQSDEVKALMAEKEREQEEKRAQVAASGGISEDKAIASARSFMELLFGITPEGMEENHYLDEEFEVPVYQVNFSIQSSCYYYFNISTADGSLVDVYRSVASAKEDTEITEAEAVERIEQNYQSAREFLEKLGIRDTYENIYCVYTVKNGVLRGRNLVFYFIKADGNAYRIDYTCSTNEFRGFTGTTLERYQEDLKYFKHDDAQTEVRCVAL